MTYLPPDSPADAPDVAPKVPPQSVLAAPRLPVTRWNRRYLAAGAAILATLVAAGFWIGFSGPKVSTKAPPPPASDVAVSGPEIPGRYANGYGDPTLQPLVGPGQGSLPPPGEPPAGQAPPPMPAASAPVDPAIQRAQQEALAARTSGPFFAAAGLAPSQPSVGPAEFAPPGPGPVAATDAPAPDVQPANGQGGKRQFAATARAEDYLPSPLRAALSPWEVKAGTVIPAALLTAINSDLPGEIIAQVTEPVYDHATGRVVLIPQGSRLIGKYDSQVAYGQERALIAWNRIVMPNGRSINIGSMEGADLSGASGLKDRVDGHFWQLARGIVLSTVFSVGAASAQDASARSSGNFVVNSAGTGVATQAQQVGQQITARDLNRQATITVRAGWPLRILVSKDMILAPYP